MGSTAATKGRLKMEVSSSWQNTAVIALGMKFNSGNIVSEGVVVGQDRTLSIKASFTLERRNSNGTFTTVDRWSADNGNLSTPLVSSHTTLGLTAGTYRLCIIVGVVKSESTEIVSKGHTRTFLSSN